MQFTRYIKRTLLFQINDKVNQYRWEAYRRNIYAPPLQCITPSTVHVHTDQCRAGAGQAEPMRPQQRQRGPAPARQGGVAGAGTGGLTGT